MPRLAACSTANFIRRRYSRERYAGSPPRATEMFATNMPLAAIRSKSWTMLSLACAPFQPIHGWMAPYSRGGVLKFAATSRTGGATIRCHGRCANNIPAMSGTRISTLEIFIRALDFHRCRGGIGNGAWFYFADINAFGTRTPVPYFSIVRVFMLYTSPGERT